MSHTAPLGRSLRPASLTGGIALLLMTVFAFAGHFVAIDGLVTPGDAARTAADIAGSETLFRSGVASLLVVAMLDVIVAAALYAVFAGVNRAVAAAAAWFRVAYAAVFTVALGHLVTALGHLDDPETVLSATETFSAVWGIGLTVFAIHLLVIGWLAIRADFMHSVFGVLLIVAGLGYLVDGFGAILVEGYAFQAAMLTFFGEIALIGWLLVRGVRTTVPGSLAVGVAEHVVDGHAEHPRDPERHLQRG